MAFDVQTTLTWYEVLELAESASQAEIEQAYKRLRKRWHPDLNGDDVAEATERFKIIQLAWEELGDPGRRTRYDDDLRARRNPGGTAEPAPEPEPEPWWEPERATPFASAKPNRTAPPGYASDPDTPQAGTRTTESTHSPVSAALGIFPLTVQRLITMRVDGHSALAAMALNLLGLGFLWWPYALHRHGTSPTYRAATAIVVVLALLSLGADVFGLLYWVASVVLTGAVIRARHQPHPAFGGASR